jgi:predicted 3-demethylubiquinone-9 3-methyltransferase (glyoxalase superfamily)
MQKISPCLWFDDQAEQAVNFYCGIFKNSKILEILHYDKASAQASGQSEGSVLTVTFELDGQKFMALNGGPIFKFTEAVSFMIPCDTQEEIDYYWEKLTADGGEESQCGWLKDKYGMSWQVYPAIIDKMLMDKDRAKAGRAMQAMLTMRKFDIAALESAFEKN